MNLGRRTGEGTRPYVDNWMQLVFRRGYGLNWVTFLSFSTKIRLLAD
jgi:hypothetical protein